MTIQDFAAQLDKVVYTLGTGVASNGREFVEVELKGQATWRALAAEGIDRTESCGQVYNKTRKLMAFRVYMPAAVEVAPSGLAPALGSVARSIDEMMSEDAY